MDNRYGVQSLHMTPGEFTIVYVDRATHHEHTVKGHTSLIPREVFSDHMGPALDVLIDALHKQPRFDYEIGEPYPTEVLETP